MDKTYSETEAQHLIAREVAKQRMGDIERNTAEMERRFISLLSELKAQIANQTILIKEQSISMEKNSENLKREIEKDFATKLEVNGLSNKVNSDFDKLNTKIDALWGKLTLIVSTITVAGLFVQYLITMTGK
jgi:hypothetical protein